MALILKPTLALILQLCAVVAWTVSAWADPVQFASAPVPPTPFMQHQAGLRGTVAQPTPGEPIAGDLYKPDGTGPFPSIVALHGCEGWPANAEGRRLQAAKYVAQGYAFLWVDSFGPRGIRQTCSPPPGSPFADRLADAYGALDWLVAQSFADPSRVAVLGASQGGSAVLVALGPTGSALAHGHRFAAGVAFYPVCSPAYAVVSAPLLVLIGALDDWTLASDCQVMAAQRPESGAPVKVVVFPEAYHAFNGDSVRAGPRQAFGHHLEYNEVATTAANAMVAEFLAAMLRQ